MRSVNYSEILHGSAALAGMLPADIDDNIFALFRTFHDLRVQSGYEAHYWPELCPVRQCFYRPAYRSTETISAGTERYFIAAKKYYLALRGQAPAVQAPATLDSSGQWVTNAAYWAECGSSYSPTDWTSGESLIEGDQRRNPYDNRNYQCHTAHVAGVNFDSTKFGELVPFQKIIPLDGSTFAPAAGTGLPAGARRIGTMALGNGVESGSVTGLGLAFTPTIVLAWITRPAGGLNLTVSPVAGSFSADGFDFELNGLTDGSGYVLNYELSNDPLIRTQALGNGVDSGTVVDLDLGFTPAQVNAWVISPADGLTLTATVLAGTTSADGFSFELSAATDSADYLLAYEIISDDAASAEESSTPIGEVRRVCQKNPRVFPATKEYRFTITDTGAQVPPATPYEVWVEFRWRRPTLIGGMWDSTAAYASGDQVYYSATTGGAGNFYTATTATTAGQSPTTSPALWSVVELPYLLRGYCIRGGYADWLRSDGQMDKAEVEDRNAIEALEHEADKLQRQQKQVRRFDVG